MKKLLIIVLLIGMLVLSGCTYDGDYYKSDIIDIRPCYTCMESGIFEVTFIHSKDNRVMTSTIHPAEIVITQENESYLMIQGSWFRIDSNIKLFLNKENFKKYMGMEK